MTVSANIWQARAAMCELLALSFRYPEDKVLAEAIASGEWGEAADEIAGALGIDWTAAAAPGAAEAAALPDPDDIQKELRPEATRLFVGAPEAACSPYEGVWRAKAEGVQPLLFVNPHSMAVERFCKACGLGRPEGTNEPLDAVWTELELLEYLALRAAADAMDAAAEADVEAGGDGAPTEEQAAQYKEVGDEIDDSTRRTTAPSPATWWPRPICPAALRRRPGTSSWPSTRRCGCPSSPRPARRIPACRSTSRPPACLAPSSSSVSAVARVGQFRGGSLCGLPSFCARASWGG